MLTKQNLQNKLETVFGKNNSEIGDVYLQNKDIRAGKGYNVLKIINSGKAVDVLFSGTNKEIDAWLDGMLFVKENLGKQFMSWVFNNNNFLLIGNTFTKEYIQTLCECTEEEAKAFIDEVDIANNDSVLEDASNNLQTLFDDWKSEREQDCN